MKFERWHDINGCGEHTVAVTNITSKQEADSIQKKLELGIKVIDMLKKDYNIKSTYDERGIGDYKDVLHYIEELIGEVLPQK